MYVASRGSPEWIFHDPSCGYVKLIHDKNKVYFHTRQEALNYGYNFCLCCSPLMKQFRKEERTLGHVCDENDLEMKVNYNNETLDVTSKISKWKITYDEAQSELVLYHKNTYQGRVKPCPFTGYHPQHVRRKDFYSIFQYIIQHDAFRKKHPVQTKGIPKKGTRTYQKDLQKYKKKQKRIKKSQGMKKVWFLLKEVEAEERAGEEKELAAAQAAETTEATCRPDNQMEEIALLPAPDIDATCHKTG